jgi:WD40 repeat protein
MDICPYKGLLPYTAHDAPYFFGRDTERRIIADNLRASRLTVFYGVSGVGKSSVLGAGVSHDLSVDPDYALVVLRDWRDDPANSLKATIRQQLEKLENVPGLNIEVGDKHFYKKLKEYLLSIDKILLVILDQFEDYFQYHPNEIGNSTFAEQFPLLLSSEDLPIHFLISIREDSLAALDSFKRKIPGLFDNRLSIDFLSPNAAKEAMLKPLDCFNENVVVARQLINAISGWLLKDISENPNRKLEMIIPSFVEKVYRQDQLACPQDTPVDFPDPDALKRLYEAVGEQARIGDLPSEEVRMDVDTADTVVRQIIKAQGGTTERVQTPYLQLVLTRWWEWERLLGSQVMRVGTLVKRGGVEKIVNKYLETIVETLDINEQATSAAAFEFMVTPAGRKIAQGVSELAESTHLEKHTVATVLGKLQQARVLAPVPPPRGSISNETCYEFAHDVVAKAALEWRKQFRQTQELKDSEMKLAEKARQAKKFRRLTWVLGIMLLLAVLASIFALTQREHAIRSQSIANVRELVSLSSAFSVQQESQRALLFAMHAVRLAQSSATDMLPEAENQLHRTIRASHLDFVLASHAGTVSSVAWRQDGRRLATGSEDGTVSVWDMSTGEKLITVPGAGDAIWGVAWSPDGKRLATAGSGHNGQVLNAVTGQKIVSLYDQTNASSSIAWSPDGKLLATASWDRTVKIWNAATGMKLLTLVGHSASVLSVAWSPDGTRLATSSEDATARVWRASTGKEILTLTGHLGAIWSVAWSPNGKKLATASHDRVTKIWDVGTGKELMSLSGHGGFVWSVAWNPDGNRLVTGSSDGTARIWDGATGDELLSLSADAVLSVAWSADGKRLATGSADRKARVWNMGAEKELVRFSTKDIYSLAWRIDGKQLALGGDDGTMRIWAVDSGQELLRVSSHHEAITSMDWRPDGELLATGSKDRTVKIWGFNPPRHLLDLTGHLNGITIVLWSPDGKRLATASLDNTTIIWDVTTGRLLLRISGHDEAVVAVAWSPDGRLLATGSRDRSVKIWDTTTGELLLDVDRGNSIVDSVVWSSDGKRLGVGSEDGTAKLWEANFKHEPLRFSTDENPSNVTWSPDLTRFVTRSWGRTKVWDASTGKELLGLSSHGEIRTVAWSKDGKKLATASSDNIVEVYAMDINDMMTLARKRAADILKISECQKYLHLDTCPPIP